MKVWITGVMLSLGVTANTLATEYTNKTIELYGGAGIYLGSSSDSDGLASLIGARYTVTNNIKVDLSYMASGSLNVFNINSEDDKVSIEDHDAYSLTIGYFHPINKRHELFIAAGYLNADVDFIDESGIFRQTNNKNEGSYHLKAGWQMSLSNNWIFGAQVGSYELIDKSITNLYATIGYQF